MTEERWLRIRQRLSPTSAAAVQPAVGADAHPTLQAEAAIRPRRRRGRTSEGTGRAGPLLRSPVSGYGDMNGTEPDRALRARTGITVSDRSFAVPARGRETPEAVRVTHCRSLVPTIRTAPPPSWADHPPQVTGFESRGAVLAPYMNRGPTVSGSVISLSPAGGRQRMCSIRTTRNGGVATSPVPPPPLNRWSARLVHRAQASDQQFHVWPERGSCGFSGLFLGTCSAFAYAALYRCVPRTRPVRCGFRGRVVGQWVVA